MGLSMTPIVAIVGRPNVGKSTLFNRLARSRDALVDDRPGVTRDRLYVEVRHGDRRFTLVDTGGFEDLGQDPLLAMVREQVSKALDEADLVVFMVDGRQGVMPGDEEMAGLLRCKQKKVFLAVNKIDGPELEHLSMEFYKLGLENLYSLSAAHGYGVGTFLSDLAQALPPGVSEEGREDRIRVAVMGRPNTGKSSLINRLLGLERLLVSELPGTTRDAVDTPFQWQGKGYLLIDTAGIRRKARVKEKIERFSVIKALRSLKRCHVAVVLLDAGRGVTDQDARICGYAFKEGRGVVLAVNKWDLVKGDRSAIQCLEMEMERKLKFLSFAPRVRISALTGEKVTSVLKQVDLVYEQFTMRAGTGRVNRAVREMIDRHPPPRVGRGRLKFFYATQAGTKPPTFVIFVNRPDAVHFSYRRFLTNQLREVLGLEHTPIRLKFRAK